MVEVCLDKLEIADTARKWVDVPVEREDQP